MSWAARGRGGEEGGERLHRGEGEGGDSWQCATARGEEGRWPTVAG